MEQGNPFFSIILPVYNAEKYLSICIDSIISQSFTDWELLCVNDGSFDGSSDILNRYNSLMHRCIKIVHKDNEGVSIARNIALKQAKGKYILFCDADDIMLPDSLQHIANALQQNPVDYLRFEYKTIDTHGNDLYPNYEAKRRNQYCGKVVDAAICIEKIVRKEFFLWSSVFKRSIIEEHHIEFLPGCTYNEDTLFMLRYFMFSKCNTYISYIAYGYRKFPEAVTASFTEKNYQDVKQVFTKTRLLYDDSDLQMQKAIKSVVESLGLRIYQYAIEHNRHDDIMEISSFCCINPLNIEWNLIKVLTYKKAYRLLPVINTMRKIRRIW